MTEEPESGPSRGRRFRTRFTWIVFGAVLLGLAFAWLGPEEDWPVFAQPPKLDIPALSVPTGDQTLRGTVVDPAGDPVADAVVEVLDDERPHWSRSGPDGAFAIAGLTVGEHEAVILADGHPPTTRPFRLPAEGAVAFTLDEPLAAIAPLPPVVRSDLTGRLSPSVGSRVAGCEVVLVPSERADPLSGATLRRVVADGSGAFVVPSVVHGVYTIRALPSWAAGGSWPVLASVDHVHGATSLEVSLPLEGARVVVQASDTAGRAVAGALLVVSPEQHPSRVWPPTHTSADGRAGVGDLPAGRYRVELRAGAHTATQIVEIARSELLEVAFDPFELR